MEFYDPNMTEQRWRSLSQEERTKERIRIRAYFLWENGMPGTAEEHTAMACFTEQFSLVFQSMEHTRSALHTTDGVKLRLLVAENLVGILFMDPNVINDATPLPQDPGVLNYLRGRINHQGSHDFGEESFLANPTVGELVYALTWEIKQQRLPVAS